MSSTSLNMSSTSHTMFSTPLIEYTLHLADNALVLGHRNSEWTGHGPILEQDIALSNVALDQIGQARYLYQYAARVMGGDISEDGLAFGRDAWDFRNYLLVEQVNGDWGKTMLRQFLFSAWQYYFYERLMHSLDRELAAVAEKSIKEVTYHLRWSGEWVIRLGDGTEESHERMTRGVDQLWKFTGELFIPAGYERALMAAGVAVDIEAIRPVWAEKVSEVFGEAGLQVGDDAFSRASAPTVGNSAFVGASAPEAGATWMQTGGKEGRHSEHLGFLLAEMQFLQRAYPDCEW